MLGRLQHHRGIQLSQEKIEGTVMPLCPSYRLQDEIHRFAEPLVRRALRWDCPADDEALEDRTGATTCNNCNREMPRCLGVEMPSKERSACILLHAAAGHVQCRVSSLATCNNLQQGHVEMKRMRSRLPCGAAQLLRARDVEFVEPN